MAFTVNDYRDLYRLLEEHPEWRADLRRLLLADDILELPRITRELAELQRATAANIEQLTVRLNQLTERVDQLAVRLDQLTQRVDDLAVRLDQLTQRVDQLTQRVDDLTVRLDQLTERVDQLAVRLDQLTQRVDDLTVQITQLALAIDSLTEGQKVLTARVGDLIGWRVEANYRERPYAYFGLAMRKARTIRLDDIPEVERAREDGRISDRDWRDLLALDVLIQGRIGAAERARDVYLALEASSIINRTDVDRAFERAEILRGLGLPVIPAVGGNEITPDAEALARQRGVAISTAGALTYWPDGLD
ncbi:MAG: hypothetical protein RMN52_10115 [Anaerolineae bacterium]|nr:hypothetical protein [Candidatus Roseilinea sp.]MDW8450349.1 hypothetical protein [Anaerolineae bacterium]